MANCSMNLNSQLWATRYQQTAQYAGVMQVEISLKTKGANAEDQEMTLRLPADALSGLKDSLAGYSQNTSLQQTQPLSSSRFRRDFSPMQTRIHMFMAESRFERTGMDWSGRQHSKSVGKVSNFQPMLDHPDIGIMTEEEEEDDRERRTRSIQDIINTKVFTPKFWDLNTPGLTYDFDATSQLGGTQDQFLLKHDLGKSTGRFPTDRMASQRSFVFNQTGKTEQGEPIQQSAHFENPSDPHSFMKTDQLQSRSRSRGFRPSIPQNPAFKNAIESTLTRFEKDMDEIFQRKPEESRSNKGPIGSHRSITTGSGLPSSKASANLGITSTASTPYGLHPEKCFKKKDSNQVALGDSDSEDDVKSARDFIQNLRKSEINRTEPVRPQEQHQGGRNLAPNQLSFKSRQSPELYRGRPSVAYATSKDSHQMAYYPETFEGSPRQVEDFGKTEGTLYSPGAALENENDEYYMIHNCTSTEGKPKNKEGFRSSVEDQEGRIVSSKLQHNLTSRINTEVNAMNDGHEENSTHRGNRFSNDSQKRYAPDFDTFSPLKEPRSVEYGESNFKSKQKGFPKKFPGLNLDLAAINIDEPQTPSGDGMSLLDDIGLDTPVMEALNSIQGKIEELNCMMNKSSLQTTGHKFGQRLSNPHSFQKNGEFRIEESPARLREDIGHKGESQKGFQLLSMGKVEDFQLAPQRYSTSKPSEYALKSKVNNEGRITDIESRNTVTDVELLNEKSTPNSNFNSQFESQTINKENKEPSDTASISSRPSKVSQQVQKSQTLIDKLKRASDSSHFWQPS